MNLEFRYGIDIETDRVKKTLEKMGWYQIQGYRPSLPDSILEGSTEGEIRDAVTKEYREESYRLAEKNIRAEFDRIGGILRKTLEQYFESVPSSLSIKLTGYGTSGSFQLPNFIVFDVYDRRGVKTIFHELIHLCLEEEFQKNAVGHWDKERIVDLILHSEQFSFVEYADWQRDYHDAEHRIDKIFAEYFFSDRDRFYSEICGAR